MSLGKDRKDEESSCPDPWNLPGWHAVFRSLLTKVSESKATLLRQTLLGALIICLPLPFPCVLLVPGADEYNWCQVRWPRQATRQGADHLLPRSLTPYLCKPSATPLGPMSFLDKSPSFPFRRTGMFLFWDLVPFFKIFLQMMLPSTTKACIPLVKYMSPGISLGSGRDYFQKRKAEFPPSQIQSIFLL